MGKYALIRSNRKTITRKIKRNSHWLKDNGGTIIRRLL